MRNVSKLVMGTLLLVGMSLFIVLGLALVLLAELYCSFFSRRRRIPVTNSSAAENDQKPKEEESKINTILQESKLIRSPLCPSTGPYSQGVLRPPPRALLFGTRKEEEEAERQLQAPHKPTSTALHLIGLISASSQAPSPPLVPPLLRKKPPSSSSQAEIVVEEDCAGILRNSSGGCAAEQFLCISNPIYDEEACIGSTPFQTPDTSPSRLQEDECSETEDVTESPSPPPAACVLTPPLSPMKKLPPNAASVTLTDGRSLIASTTNSNASSSTSASPRTSPSW